MAGLHTVALLEDPVPRCAIPENPSAGPQARPHPGRPAGPGLVGRHPRPARARVPHVVRSCVAAGFEPNVTFESDDYETVQGLVATSIGVALVPRLALTRVRPGIVVRELGPLKTRPAPSWRRRCRGPCASGGEVDAARALRARPGRHPHAVDRGPGIAVLGAKHDSRMARQTSGYRPQLKELTLLSCSVSARVYASPDAPVRHRRAGGRYPVDQILRRDGDAVLIVLHGELDLASAPELERELREAEGSSPSRVANRSQWPWLHGQHRPAGPAAGPRARRLQQLSAEAPADHTRSSAYSS